MNLCDSSTNLVHERMDQKFSQEDKQLIIREMRNEGGGCDQSL